VEISKIDGVEQAFHADFYMVRASRTAALHAAAQLIRAMSSIGAAYTASAHALCFSVCPFSLFVFCCFSIRIFCLPRSCVCVSPPPPADFMGRERERHELDGGF